MRYILYIFAFIALPISAQQQTLTLDLERTVQLAGDSSLSAFRAKNMYLVSYWQHRTFIAGRLPSLSLNMTPLQYNRRFISRYDPVLDIDVYRRQQAFSASGGFSARQNFDLTGGTFFLESDLGYLRHFGYQSRSQFSSVPIRLRYHQNLIGFNPFRWERRIEPLRFCEPSRN